jgi:WS/DGAT/MGAT family acyltransferase
MTNRERISGVDTAWLRMEQPTNLMMIVGVLVLQGRVDPRALRKVIAERFLAFPRFLQRAVVDDGMAVWEADPAFDLERHVVRERLGRKPAAAALEDLVSRLASTPLPGDRPRWCFHVVERYGAGSAIVVRIHHCYADGVALVQVLLSLTDAAARGHPRRPGASRERREASPPGVSAWIAAYTQAGGLEGLARKGAALAWDAASLALMAPDSPSPLKGPLGPAKRAAWAEPLPLDEVKAIGKALGCSINDVLLALAAGALRRYFEARGVSADGIGVRVLVPVNLRRADEALSLGNRFGLVFLDLPIGLRHPLERLYEVHRRMQALRDSWQPLIVLALLNAVGAGPEAVQRQVAATLARCASAVVTNVPGPREPRYIAGQRIEALDFWVPQSGGIGLGLSILSYAGRIHFGVLADAQRVPEPRALVECFAEEYEQLLWITLMSPWVEA